MTPEQESTFGHKERDWPEDFPHENGNYRNICGQCKEDFIGHKRRPACRKCTSEIVKVPKSVAGGLRHACNGHPAAQIPWPHRLLHEAADHIESLESTLSKLEAGTHVLVPVEPTEDMVLRGYREPRENGPGITPQERAENAIRPIWRAMITAAQEGE